MPVLSATRSADGDLEVKRLIAVSAGTLGVVLVVLTALGVAFAPAVIAVFAVGFVDDPVKFEAASDMLRWTFPYLLLISLSALFAGVLNTYNRFAIPAFSPVWLNVCLITAAVVFAPSTHALAVAVLVAGVVQLGFHLPSVSRLGVLTWPRVNFSDPQVRRILRMMGPILFGSSVAQINLLLDTILASLLVTGSISWLYFSDRLMEFPVGVFGIALATVILPKLATQISERAVEEYFQTIDWALRLVLLVVFPAAVALVALAYPLMVTLFQYGEFSVEDARMAAKSLVAFSPGLIGFVLVKVLAPGFYARMDTKTPVRAGVIAMVVNALCAVILTKALLFGHVGLAAAVSISGIVNAGLLYRYMVRDSGYTSGPGMGGFVVKTAAAAIVMGVVLWFGVPDRQFWTVASLGGRLWQLVIWVPAGTVVYFGCLYLVGLKPHRLFQPQA